MWQEGGKTISRLFAIQDQPKLISPPSIKVKTHFICYFLLFYQTNLLFQMRIIHGSGYTDEEKLTFVPLISKNIQSSIKTLIKSMEYLSKLCMVSCYRENRTVCGQVSSEFHEQVTTSRHSLC